MRSSPLPLILVLLFTNNARAVEGDTFRPVVSYGYSYDSNLFRLENDFAAVFYGIDTSIHSDTFQRLGVGFDLDWKQGRQRVVAKALASKTRFDRYSLLDYTGQDANLEWQWQLGNYWSGKVGMSRTKSLGTFREVTGLVSNTRTSENQFFDANYRIHPRWQASLRLNSGTYTYSAAAQRASNSETDARTLGVYYLGSTLQRIGVELRESEIFLPNRALTPTLDNDYMDRSFNLVANWQASGKSGLNVRIGRVERKNKHISTRDYSGLNWRLDGNWAVSGKSLVGASLFREVRNTEYTTSNHSMVSGGTLSYIWQFMPKTRMQASLGQEDYDYDGIARRDKIKTATVAVVHEPWVGGELSAGIQRETRDSNAFLYSYKSNALFLNANLKF